MRVPSTEVGSEIFAPSRVEPIGADDGYDADEEDYERIGDATEC